MKNWLLYEKLMIAVALVVGAIGVIGYFYPPSIPRGVVGEKFADIAAIKNEARLKPTKSSQWYTLSSLRKNEIFENDILATGEDSEVKVIYGSGEELLIGANSLIVFRRSSQGGIEFYIEYGQIPEPAKEVTKVERKELAKKIKVKKWVQARSTSPAPRQEAPLAEKEGPAKPPEAPVVQFTPPVVQAPLIEEPTKPKVLIPRKWPVVLTNLQTLAPDLKSRWKGEKFKVSATWNPLKSAENYDVVVVKKTPLKKIIFRRDRVLSPHYALASILPGEYEIQVFANLDPKQRLPATVFQDQRRPFSIPALESYTAPGPLFPKQKQVLIRGKGAALVFKWQKSTQFTDYVVQFSRQSDFSLIESERWTQESFIKGNLNLEDGIWYWRVAGLSVRGESPWGASSSFRLMAVGD